MRRNIDWFNILVFSVLTALVFFKVLIDGTLEGRSSINESEKK